MRRVIFFGERSLRKAKHGRLDHANDHVDKQASHFTSAISTELSQGEHFHDSPSLVMAAPHFAHFTSPAVINLPQDAHCISSLLSLDFDGPVSSNPI